MSDFAVRFVTVLEIDLDLCANTFSVPPCTATAAAGGECYNTFQTCQDKANFIKTVKTWRFGTPGHGAPASEGIRPYLLSDGLDFAPTEIDLERGLARRSLVNVRVADETDSDLEADPYAETRTVPPQGTFFSRLIARNRNYAGRFARIRRGYLMQGAPFDWADFTNELYVIESIDGPDSSGIVTIELKDPVKLTDRAKIPSLTDGALSIALGASDLSLTLEPGDGAQYAASGFVRIGDELIEYTGKAGDVLSWPNTTFRGKFGTTAAAANAGDGVQQCKVYQAQRVWEVLDDLLLEAGIPAGNIDSAGFQAEDDLWLGTAYTIEAQIVDPEDISKLLGDLLVQIGGFMWWSPTEQKVKFKVNAPVLPTAPAVRELTEAAHIIEGTVKVTVLDELRTTRRGINFALRSATADRKDPVSYLRGKIYIDLDAESANEYGDKRESHVESRWFTGANDAAMLAQVSRTAGYYRNAPRRIELRVDAKDADIREGDLVDLTIQQIAATDGAPLTIRCLVMMRRDLRGQIALRLRTTSFGARYGFIGPAGIGDYPADPLYAHVAPDANGFTIDGSEPYLII